MDTVEYGKWSLDVHRMVAGKRLPVSAAIEITQRCNNKCIHCYNNRPAGDGVARAAELSTDEHLRLLDEITGAGCLWVLFTGGEVFLRPDFPEIYTHAKRRGLLVTLFTNATLITKPLVALLERYRPFSVEVTLYGATAETYECVTGVSGSFSNCLRGIRLLRERNLPLKLKTMALRTNVHELELMKRFADEELGLPFKFDAMLSPRTDCARAPLAQRLSPAEVLALDLNDSERAAGFKRLAENLQPAARRRRPGDGLYLCGGGAHSFAVDPYGKLRICVLSNGDGYDFRQGSFEEGWDEFLQDVRRQRPLANRCSDCSLRSLCGMCPANGALECGDPEQPVDFLCQVAHLRAAAFGMEIAPHGDCAYCSGGSKHEDLRLMLAAARRQRSQYG